MTQQAKSASATCSSTGEGSHMNPLEAAVPLAGGPGGHHPGAHHAGGRSPRQLRSGNNSPLHQHTDDHLVSLPGQRTWPWWLVYVTLAWFCHIMITLCHGSVTFCCFIVLLYHGFVVFFVVSWFCCARVFSCHGFVMSWFLSCYTVLSWLLFYPLTSKYHTVECWT